MAKIFNLKRYAEEDWYSEEVANDPNTDPEILARILRRGKSDWVSEIAARNPNCPSEALAEVLRRGNNDYVSWHAAENPNCPPEVLAEVLSRGNNDNVSWYAAENPNTPIEDRLRWIENTGERFNDLRIKLRQELLEKEEKDIQRQKELEKEKDIQKQKELEEEMLQRQKIKEIEKEIDLEDLELISKSKSWYKISQANITIPSRKAMKYCLGRRMKTRPSHVDITW